MPHTSLILLIPHSSTLVPHDLRDCFALTDAELTAELLAMTDSFTDELFAGDESFVRVSPNRPDFCIGTDEYHTPPQLVDIATQYLERAGYSVAINRPFAGTIVPMAHYHANASVSSLMIEVSRGLYMDEATGEQRPDFEAIASVLRRLLSVLAAA